MKRIVIRCDSCGHSEEMMQGFEVPNLGWGQFFMYAGKNFDLCPDCTQRVFEGY